MNSKPKKKIQKKFPGWQDNSYNVDKYMMPDIKILNMDDYSKKVNEAYQSR